MITEDTTPRQLENKEGGITESPELSFSFTDDELVNIINQKMSEAETHYSKKLEIKERSKKLKKYWKGEQIDETKKEVDSSIYVNNIIHRNLETKIRNAVSRIPDIIVTAGDTENEEDKKAAKKIEQWLRVKLDSDVIRRLAKGSLRDNRLSFIGVWKYRFDFEEKRVVVERIRPEDVTIDHTARIPESGFTADNCEFIAEWIEEPVAVVIRKFPDKRDIILSCVGKETMDKGQAVAMASKLRYLEVWATMHDKDGYSKELTFWKIKNYILGKSDNVYYDYSAPIDLSGIGGPSYRTRNHFKRPRKPYTFFSGENLGESPLDSTNEAEVSLPLQDIINKRGNQITLTNDWAIPKLITSSKYIAKDQVNNITRDPREIIFLNEDAINVRDAIVAISSAPASPALYSDMESAKRDADAHFSTNPISRGEDVSAQSGLSKQISREGDLSAADDLSQTMIQRALEEAANWHIHLAKLFSDEPDSEFVEDSDGDLRGASLTSDMIPDGVKVVVKANSVDKPTMRALMMDLASKKAVDPYTLFQELDLPNPKELTKRLLDFLVGPSQGFALYKQGLGLDTIDVGVPSEEGETMPSDSLPTAGPAAPGGVEPPLPPAV